MTTEHLDPEWLNWVQHNLERRCAPSDLYKIMREHGFSVAVIKAMMGEAYPTGIEATETLDPKNTDIDYLALANPPLCQFTPDLTPKRFDNDLLQLYTIESFLSPEECEHLIAVSEEHLKPSQVTHSNGDERFRTSETCDFTQVSDPAFVKYIDEKISQTLGICLPYSEPIQVQRYDIGQEFKAHHDYFAPNTNVYEQFAGEMGQRTWTFMVYLNNTPQGGGTKFVDIGQTFYPQQGMAVVWNNLHSDGTPNRHSLHHGMPVEEGKKVIITKWFREKGYGPMFHGQAQTQTQSQTQTQTQSQEQSTQEVQQPNTQVVATAKKVPSAEALREARQKLSRQARRAKAKRRS
ncbi:MAG: 2OG-Fe(II) oxygenase [Thiofilum sp.]|uniref:prolyl hydroxylase family protein n=1 Tax=Thiofilum sp. TaxID=2212733 RepID=UPI0025DC3CC1|nr:2OG-Fe(II) oxygenase [Thiofilum sp.]MBK8452713.1 2OG-Fe(II) oxygenase [Thiofilum sp.]